MTNCTKMTTLLQQLNDTANVVVNWFQDHDILPNSSYKNQIKKFKEELQELKDATNDDERLDAIGDTLVVAVGLSLLNYKRCRVDTLDVPVYTLDETINDIIGKRIVNPYCALLNSYVAEYGIDTVLTGFRMAAIVISARTGKMVDGLFVKDVPTATVLVPRHMLTRYNISVNEIDSLIATIRQYATYHKLSAYKIEFGDNAKLTWI